MNMILLNFNVKNLTGESNLGNKISHILPKGG